jgi:hypothetical protein
MYEQVCYQKSYLKQVIAKIDFASPLSQIQNGVPSKLTCPQQPYQFLLKKVRLKIMLLA